jgi:hypothetical protein
MAPINRRDVQMPVKAELFLVIDDPRAGSLRNVPIKVQEITAQAPEENKSIIPIIEFKFDMYKSVCIPFCDLSDYCTCTGDMLKEMDHRLRSSSPSLNGKPETKTPESKYNPDFNPKFRSIKACSGSNMMGKTVNSGEKSVNYKENRG